VPVLYAGGSVRISRTHAFPRFVFRPCELLPHVPIRHAVASVAENCEPVTVNMWIQKVTYIPFTAGYTPLSPVWLLTRGEQALVLPLGQGK
jgi:hypothetical protein